MSEEEKFDNTPAGLAKKWTVEITAAKEKPSYKKFLSSGETVIKRFRDEDEGTQINKPVTQRLNLFHANVTTVRAMLFGRIPKIEVDRRFADANDDVARVACRMLERILNYDVEEEGEAYSEVMRSVLDDRLLPGMGNARQIYRFKEVNQEIGDQWTETKYTNWKDFLWSPCRTWDECRWVAFRSYLSKDEVIATYGDKYKDVPLNSKGFFPDEKNDLGSKAEVWTIWCKESKSVYDYVEGYDEILKATPDPWEYPDFFPCPKPFASNLTTEEFLPRADYCIAQDLYTQIDELQSRIATLTKAVRLVGVYDKNAGSIQRMLKEGADNELIPVESWSAFSEKSGLKGCVDWLPLKEVVETLDKLREVRDEQIRLLYQVTGMSDIIRGAESERRTSATEQSIKAKFASIRVQAMQDEFARFATDLQKIKVWLIGKFYTPQNIVKYSNLQFEEADKQYIVPAVELIKSNKITWRVTIRPETLAMTDYAQLKQDRTEFINALAVFLQSAAPIVEFEPGAAPALLSMLKWGMAGFKGSNEIEGTLDQAISQMQNKPPQDKPDPKAEAAKAQLQMKQEEHQMKMQQGQQEFQLKMQEMQQKFALEMRQMQAETQAKLADIRMDMIKSYQELQAHAAKIQMERQDAETRRDSE